MKAHEDALKMKTMDELTQEDVNAPIFESSILPTYFTEVYFLIEGAVKKYLGDEDFIVKLLYAERRLGSKYINHIAKLQTSQSNNDTRHYYRLEMNMRNSLGTLKASIISEIENMVAVMR